MLVRPGRPEDADAIAALHAASWSHAYRGIMSDTYLDGPIGAERQALWRKRLAEPSAQRILMLGEDDGRLIAFACIFLDHDPQWGALVDNLHVAPGAHGIGLGRTIFHAAAMAMPESHVAKPIHLTVFTANMKARGFYERVGGRAVEAMHLPQPDGQTLPVLR